MSSFELYVFLLCLFVLIALTALFSVMITIIIRNTLKLIRLGEEDKKIIKILQQEKKKRGFVDAFSMLFSSIICVLLIIAFVFSLMTKIGEDDLSTINPLRVVKSDSMSYADEKNDYLEKNSLTDQFNTFDLLITQPIPAESDLELYDIVIYEHKQTGRMIIHRIVEIEEANKKHPDCRYFTLQGDAVRYKDDGPVLYGQMRGIYRGDRIPNVGSFIMFMQSPAGYLCLLLMVLTLILSPIAEHILQRARLARWAVICQGSHSIQEDTKKHKHFNPFPLLAVGAVCAGAGFWVGRRKKDETQKTKKRSCRTGRIALGLLHTSLKAASKRLK
ncbi:MAG: hypothetical protein IJZ80_05900 [Clostridia bacterium]|nr:hypothetical protein [Clostridia bacterium]